MRTLQQSVREMLGAALPNGGRLGVAVSGGADSTALLDLIARLGPESGITPVVLHFDHGLRPDSVEDRLFVERLAADRQCAFHHEKPANGTSPPAGSIEDWARQERYDFFSRAARLLDLRAVATGHTADDQAETILFRLLIRGAGPRGLAGIPPVRDAGAYLILRPLLAYRRAEIAQYLENRGLSFRDDPTNRTLLFTRNKIRHQVIPFLIEQCNPRLVESLCRTAEILRMENDFLEEAAAKELERWTLGGRASECPTETVAALPEALRFRVLHRLIESRGVYPSFDLVESVARLGRTGGRIDLSPELAAWIEGGMLRLGRRPEAGPAVAGDFEISVPETTAIPALRMTIETARLEASPRLSELRGGRTAAPRLENGFQATAHIAGAAIRGRLVVRTRRPGDRMAPFGLAGTKKLQDIFTDEKISRAERDRWPLLCDDDGVLWIIGVCQDERTRVADGADAIVRVWVTLERTVTEDPEEIA